eukprot:6550575-Alexandrium_andersonii.AAC.1
MAPLVPWWAEDISQTCHATPCLQFILGPSSDGGGRAQALARAAREGRQGEGRRRDPGGQARGDHADRQSPQ